MKKPKKKLKIKTPKLSTVKRKAWEAFSLYIRTRDKGICISCGRQDEIKNMDAGHYIAKTRGLSIYFDEQNVAAQCRACNRFSAGNLPSYALALRQRYGEGILEELDKRRREIKKYSVMEYQELIEHYKELLKTL
jgi:hypothetical protein